MVGQPHARTLLRRSVAMIESSLYTASIYYTWIRAYSLLYDGLQKKVPDISLVRDE